MAIVRLRENGPIVIEGDDVVVVDWQGRPYPITRRPIALCRCGQSQTKPFCDGSHRTCGFVGNQAADMGSGVVTEDEHDS
jgi:CDGSH-type Zn-finger protein